MRLETRLTKIDPMGHRWKICEPNERRGAHTREDYKNKEEKFDTVNTILRRGEDGEMQVSQESIPELPAELKQVIEDHK